MNIQTKTYPLLTLQKLSLLERRVRNYNITQEDLELMDHYADSVGSADFIKRCCEEEGILSIEEALEVIKYRDNNFTDGYAASGLTGALSGMIKALKHFVTSGDEIY